MKGRPRQILSRLILSSRPHPRVLTRFAFDHLHHARRLALKYAGVDAQSLVLLSDAVCLDVWCRCWPLLYATCEVISSIHPLLQGQLQRQMQQECAASGPTLPPHGFTRYVMQRCDYPQMQAHAAAAASLVLKHAKQHPQQLTECSPIAEVQVAVVFLYSFIPI